MRYSRWVSDTAEPDALERTEQHVRAHLSSVADPDDDTERHAAEVRVRRRRRGAGTVLIGELDREPDAPYVWAAFDVDADADTYAYVRTGDTTRGGGR